jgi:hypothetical protein
MMFRVRDASPAGSESHPGRQPSKRLLLVLAVAVAAGIGLLFALLPSGEEGDRTAVRGVYVLVDPSFAAGSVDGEWDACGGAGKYDDFAAGVEVLLTDEHGRESSGRLRNAQASDAALLEELNDANAFFDGSHMDGQAIVAGLEELSDIMCVMLFDLAIPVASSYRLTVRDWVDRPIMYERIEERGFTLQLLRGANLAP